MEISLYTNIRYGDIHSLIYNAIRQAPDHIKKVGIINWWWLTPDEIQLENLKNFVELQDICFFISEEIFDRYYAGHEPIDMNKVFELLNSYNVYYIVFSHDLTLNIQPDKNRTFYNPWFFKSPLYIPSNFNADLDYIEKPYAFNLMLGSRKSYRTIVYNILKNNKNIYSKYLGHPKFKFDDIPNLDDYEVYKDLTSQDVAKDKLNTMNSLEKEGSEYPISHIVPLKIYSNTHFDIVTETLVKYQNMFITEKTAKPLATGRFFCWFNSSNVIDYLRKFGFDFANYEAEYDKIQGDIDRLDAMLEVVGEIVNNPLYIKDIYKKTKNARIHNMNLFKEHTNNFKTNLSNWILMCLNK